MWSKRINFQSLGGIKLRNILAILALLMACHAVYAAELFGSVDSFSGSAVVSDQYGKSTSVYEGLKIYEGQTISSGHDGEVQIVTEDGGIIAVRPDTVFRVDQYKAEGGSADKIFMSLLSGAMRSITGWIGKHDSSAYRVTTPSATIGIRGTDHEVTVIDKGDGDEPGTYDTVNEGSTVLKTPQGQAEVSPGKFAFAPRGRAAAPFFLTNQPHFWARRRLRIEARIQQRKEYFHGRLERMRDDRIKHLRTIRGNRLQHGSQQRRDNARVQSRSMAAGKVGENRLEQARQRRLEGLRSRDEKSNELNARQRQKANRMGEQKEEGRPVHRAEQIRKARREEE